MTKARISLVGASVVTLFLVTLAAKGSTVKLTVAGPGLAHPIDITSSDALVNVWDDDLIRTPAAAPDKALPRYLISFYVEPLRSTVRMMYVVHYVRNYKTGEGFIYLPAPGEEWYRLNISTIMREAHDGRWHHAPKAWSNAIAAALKR
jgi:hypothetical protein